MINILWKRKCMAEVMQENVYEMPKMQISVTL